MNEPLLGNVVKKPILVKEDAADIKEVLQKPGCCKVLMASLRFIIRQAGLDMRNTVVGMVIITFTVLLSAFVFLFY